jgi:hypothetical protein
VRRTTEALERERVPLQRPNALGAAIHRVARSG